MMLSTPTITDREFQLFQALVLRQSGIFLGEHKRALVVGRLSRRMRELGLTSMGAYYDLVMRTGEAELTQVIDSICTNETRFFREADHFSFLETRALREIEARAEAGRIPRRLRVWSAACSSGEEPYSLAMTLRTRFPRSSGWQLEILASDLSTRILDRAREAVWPIQRSTDIPPEHLKRYMLRGTSSQLGKMKAGAEIRDLVEFRRINLNDESYPVEGKFDLIFCRNVLIYFDRAGKANVARRLLGRLSPHGYLFLGHAETMAGISDEVQTVGPSVYQLKSRPEDV